MRATPVLERQNKKQEAVHMYMFALERNSGSGPEKDELRARINEHFNRAMHGLPPAELQWGNAAGEVSEMRTIKLSLKATEEASAQFFLVFARDPKTSEAAVQDVKFIDGSESLKSAASALKSAPFHVALPAGESPRLVRRGVLFCSPVSGCSFTLLNPEDVRSLN